jgi:hypothetical protein
MFKAEESRQNLIELNNHMPDAVIIMQTSPGIRNVEIYKESTNEGSYPTESLHVGNNVYELLYTNEQTDKFFGVNLSGLDNNSDKLKKSAYKLLRPRNLLEINLEERIKSLHTT